MSKLKFPLIRFDIFTVVELSTNHTVFQSYDRLYTIYNELRGAKFFLKRWYSLRCAINHLLYKVR
jgi:hypothetical protein